MNILHIYNIKETNFRQKAKKKSNIKIKSTNKGKKWNSKRKATYNKDKQIDYLLFSTALFTILFQHDLQIQFSELNQN